MFRVLIGAIMAYFATSLIEYLLHRLYLHKEKDHSHIVDHHRKYNSQANFAEKNIKFKDVASSWLYISLTSIMALPFGFLAYYFFDISLISYILISAGYAMGLEIMHFLFHADYDGLLSQTSIYKHLRKHHVLHHTVYDKNYGIGSDTWDIILRTKNKEV